MMGIAETETRFSREPGPEEQRQMISKWDRFRDEFGKAIEHMKLDGSDGP